MKEWEGMIEREFTVVLYADNKFNDAGVPSYYLNTVEEGTSAKCPPGLLGENIIKIENDSQLIFDKVLEFVGENKLVKI